MDSSVCIFFKDFTLICSNNYDSHHYYAAMNLYNIIICTKALTFVLTSLLFTATVLEGLFGEYHSSAALVQQRPEVTKQPLVCDLSVTSEVLCDATFLATFLCPLWDWTALPLFTPFAGPDGSSHHYSGRFLHLGAVTTQG